MKTAWEPAEALFANSDAVLPHATGTLVVGAGITGLTAALELQKAGCNVTVVEWGSVGGGTTGRSSAHLTTLPDSGLAQTENTFSAAANAQVVTGMQEAIATIGANVRDYSIDCGFKRVSGYYFTEDDEAAVARERSAAAGAGLEVIAAVKVPLPFPVRAAFRLSGQALFDPAAYIRGLALAFRESGGSLLENTRVIDFHDGSPCTAETSRGRIEAQSIIFATHTPPGRSLLHAELKPVRSYLIAVEMQDEIPEALFWDTASPYHYIRRIGRADGAPLVLAGGADHPTGKSPDADPYQTLEDWLRARLRCGRVVHKWSAQLYEPIDGFPYVGKPLTGRNIYAATGFNGDGLTLGTVAGGLLADLILDRENELARLLSPSRVKLAAAGEAISLNAEVARHLVGGRDNGAGPDPGSGWVRGSEKGTTAEYLDRDGTRIQLSARCPHMGCVVQWNPVEETWDCPCHGSRFTPRGTCLEGPSRSDLKKLS